NGRTGYHAAGSAPKRGLPHFRKRPVIAAMTQSWVVPLDLAPPLRAGAFYCRRQLLANAAIAALACRLIAVRGALDAVGTVAARQDAGAALRRSRLQMEDAANDLAVFEHIIVVIAPTRGVAALEGQLLHLQPVRRYRRYKNDGK